MNVSDLKNSFLYLILFVTSTACQVLNELEWHTFRQDTSLAVNLTLPKPGNSVQIEFMIRMAVDSCCPMVLIQTKPLDELIKTNGCYDIQPDILPYLFTLQNYISLDWRDALESPNYLHDNFLGYHFENDQQHYRIFGRHETNFIEIGYVNIYIFYPCYNKQLLSFEYKTSMTVMNLTIADTVCNQFGNGSPCAQYYSKWSLPNILGNKELSKAVRSISILSGIASSECHQYVMELMCHMIFPECIAKHQLAPLPCQSMCIEVFDTCQNEYSQLLGMSGFLPKSTPQVLKYSIEHTFCNLLPKSTQCFYKNVSCGAPKEIDQGKHDYAKNVSDVTSVTHYTCNEGYYSEGNSTSFCQYSGKWSQPPQCLLKQTSKTIIILSSVFGVFLIVTVILIVLVYKYRKELAAILYVRLGIQFAKKEEEDRQYDAFISYSPEDIQFVKNKLLEPLESREPPFRICLPDRDFEVGGFRHNKIIRSIQESNRTIVVLSQSFITNQWCQFEFAQAHLHTLEDQSHRLLVIALEDPKTLQNTPEVIDSYIQSITYLAREDRLFWQKLLYQMPRK